jgi:hypothetical protein
MGARRRFAGLAIRIAPARVLAGAAIVAAIGAPAAARAQALPSTPAACAIGDLACASSTVSTSQTDNFRIEVRDGAVRRNDRAFQIVLGSFITAAGSDITLSMYQIGKGNAREAGFGSWWQKSPAALAVSKSAMIAFFAYEVQQVHKDRPKLAIILGVTATAVETALAVRSARMRALVPGAPPAF